MAWCHIREFVWNWLDTESELRIVAAPTDSQLQGGLVFGTSAEILFLLAILQVCEVDQLNYESVCWYFLAPSSDSCTSSVDEDSDSD